MPSELPTTYLQPLSDTAGARDQGREIRLPKGQPDGFSVVPGEPGARILPRTPHNQVPDLDLVFQDITQLNLPVSREEIISASEVYVGMRDAIYQDGYEPSPGAEPVRGMPGLTAYCRHAVVMGVLAIRDPLFREALRVVEAYYANDEGVDDEGSEPGLESE